MLMILMYLTLTQELFRRDYMKILSALLKDAYKAFHPHAYHPDVTHVYSNFTNRFGKYSNTWTN